ncbi:MAG: hypothetical protein WBA23_07645 [Tunicatimonas sp.]|uniref:hypothetical protein n=1 Tax=Tunicatimonas sp. TaxID=1940096 RepID=UPI003C78CEE5
MTIDFFLVAIIILFVQYTGVYLFIRLGSRWAQQHSVLFYTSAALVGTLGFSLIFSLYKWHFGFTFVSVDYEFARNCLGLLTFLMIGKIYGLMPVEFLVRHLPIHFN